MQSAICNFVIKVKNALDAKCKFLRVRIEKHNLMMISQLYSFGLIRHFKCENGLVTLYFKYRYGTSIFNINLVSKMSNRAY